MSEKRGMSLSDFFGIIFKRKLLLLIITLSLACVVGIFILKVYNKSTQYYFVEFEYKFSTLSEGKFYDGSDFEYRSIISEDAIEEAKASSDEFKDIDAEKLFEKGISIEKVEETYESYYQRSVYNTKYEISVTAKYFEDKVQARNFVKALVDVPNDENIEILSSLKYDINLQMFEESKSYEEQITFLTKQYEMLTEYYEEMIEDFGDRLMSDGELLSEKIVKIDKLYEELNLDQLGLYIDSFSLVKDYDYSKLYYTAAIKNITDSINVNELKIQDLQKERDAILDAITKNSSTIYDTSTDALNEEISNLLAANETLSEQRRKYQERLDFEDPSTLTPEEQAEHQAHKEELEETLNEGYNQFKTLTTDYVKAVKEVNSDANFVYYYRNSVVKLKGGLSFIVAGIISALVGFVVAAIVNFSIGWKEYKAKQINPSKKEEIELKA